MSLKRPAAGGESCKQDSFMPQETSSYDIKTLRGMRTRAKKKYVASDRARRENVPRHILFHVWNLDWNGGNDEKAWENTSPS